MLVYLDSNTAQSIQSQLPYAAVRAVNAQNKKPELSTSHTDTVSVYMLQSQKYTYFTYFEYCISLTTMDSKEAIKQ